VFLFSLPSCLRHSRPLGDIIGGMNDVIPPATNALGVVPQRSTAQHARARPSTLPKRGSASFGYISILEELVNMSADIRFKGLTPKAEVVCDQKKGT
jgi:hypothetical protein